MKIAITNGKILDPESGWKPCQNLLIESGRIREIDGNLDAFRPDETVDATSCHIVPGLIDLSVSLREPGHDEKGTIASETAAAAAGGVTTLCCPPNTQPVNDSKAVTNLIEEVANREGRCRVLPLGALTRGLNGEALAEYASLKNAGCVALSNGFNALKNLAIAKRCFEYAKTHELSVFLNPLEPSLHQGSIHAGDVSTTIGLQGIPSIAESIAVSQFIHLAQATGVHLHFSQLSAEASVDLVREAKLKGLPISADVAIHNLIFTDRNTLNFNSMFHCQPPLRSETDRQALLAGVRDGTIDCITSAHQPHEAAAKQMPFAETEPGMSGVELLLPLASKLAAADELPLEKFIHAMTAGPAKVLGLPRPTLDIGQTADLVLLNGEHSWTVNSQTYCSRGHNTPLFNTELEARVVMTLLEGKVVHKV